MCWKAIILVIPRPLNLRGPGCKLIIVFPFRYYNVFRKLNIRFMDFLDDNSVKIRLLVMDIQVLLQWTPFIHMFVAFQPRFFNQHWRGNLDVPVLP